MKHFLLLLFFCTPLFAKADMLITLIGINRTAPSSFDVVVKAESLTPVDTLIATVSDRSVNLVLKGDGLYHGIIELGGLPEGMKTLNVYAVNQLGDVRTATRDFMYDTPPSIELESPVTGTAYNKKLHIKIKVSDVGSTAVVGAINVVGARSAIEFVNTLDTLLDPLPEWTSLNFTANITAYDNANQQTRITVLGYKEAGPLLSKVWEVKGGGNLKDVKGNRALLQTHPLSSYMAFYQPGYKIADLSDGSEQVVKFDRIFGDPYYVLPILCDGGAAFYVNYGLGADEVQVEVWRHDSLIHLSASLGVLATGVHGTWENYLVWRKDDGALCITNLTTMQTIYHGTNISAGGISVTEDGKIVYLIGGNLYTYQISTGIETQITTSGKVKDPTAPYGEIVYKESRNAGTVDSMILYNGVTSISLGVGADRYLGYGYGSLYFTKLNPLGRNRMFVRMVGHPELPDVELFPTDGTILTPAAIGPGGAAVTAGGKTYFDTTYRDGIAAAASANYGWAFFKDSSFYKALGNSLFRILAPMAAYPPKLLAILPDTAVSGQQIILKGRHFAGITGVTLGGEPVDFEMPEGQDTMVIVTVGRGASGDVVIVTPVGTDTLKNAFTYIQGPRIRDVSVMRAMKGDEVVIRGTLFNTVTAVSFGGVPAASFTVVNDSTIRATVGDDGNGYVLVSGVKGSDILKGFVFIYPPKINSISLSSVRMGTPVTIRGSGFTDATAVTFGGMPARVFTVVGDSTIMAIVGRGMTGDVAVTTRAGTGVLPGLVFVGPVILSVSPMRGKNGDVITVRGINLSGFTSLRFGNYPPYANQSLSDTMVKVVLGSGGTGDVTIATSKGKDTLPGFIYYYKPVIKVLSPSVGKSGAVITIRGNYFTDASVVKFGGVEAASFTVVNDSVITAVVGEGASGEVSVTTPASVARMSGFVFQRDLPDDIFTVKNMNITCRGVKDGSITVTAAENASYNAKISGGGWDSTFTFTKSATVGKLSAGTYSLCITAEGQERCFTSVLTQPEDLRVMVAVVQREVVLNLGGSEVYNISLNDSVFSVLSGEVRLPLHNGRNVLSVSTDKYCQGTVYKEFNVGNGMSVYPNPFHTSFNMNLVAKRALVQVFDVNGQVVWSKVYNNQAGVLNIDLGAAVPGLYVVKVSADGEVRNFKILKN